jgi:uncharacterized membrane protein YidH (DUF202 family)
MVVLEGLGARSSLTSHRPSVQAATRGGGGPGGREGLPSAQPGAVTLAAEQHWLAWRRHVLTQLVLVTALYTVAHLLFVHRWSQEGSFALSTELQAALLLFVLGLLVLARLMRTLDDRAAAYHRAGVQQAGTVLVLSVGLCFSPCVWLLLCQ